jgi:DNA-binding MarR family transcriptional regulator
MPADDNASFAFEGLDKLFHERARLSIVASLAAHANGLVFNDLKRLCGLSDGNLSRQISTLEAERVVEIWKGTRNNRPSTLVRLTDDGRARFVSYLAELERVVKTSVAPTTDARPRLA